LFAIAFSMIIAPIVWNIAKEFFGAALIMIALVLLAIAGLVSLAHAQDDCPYRSYKAASGHCVPRPNNNPTELQPYARPCHVVGGLAVP
jgi:hypothetical protein